MNTVWSRLNWVRPSGLRVKKICLDLITVLSVTWKPVLMPSFGKGHLVSVRVPRGGRLLM